MSADYGYRFRDSVTGDIHFIYLPVFPEQFTNLSSPGYGTLADFDIAVNYTFDYLSTFFTISQVQRIAFEVWGLQNVYSCEELDGHTWTMIDKPDRTIEFSETSPHLTFKINGGTVGNWAGGIDENDASNLYSMEKTGNYYGECNFYMRDFDHVTTYNQVYPSQVYTTLPTHYEEFFDSPYVVKDPYEPGGPAEPGGGNGVFDGTSDPNPIPADPTISATDTGFMTVFATNLSEIQALSNSLWADIFPDTLSGQALHETVEALKNMVASPYDAILGCHIVPVAVGQGTLKNVKLYGVLPSSVSMHVASSQWVHKDCGTLKIEPYDDSYLDYAPYSKVTSLYLPFIGVVSVDIDIIMNTTIGVYYKIDIVSGQCIAFITKNGSVYFQYQGQCAVPLPVTSIDWSNTVNAGLGIVGSIGSIAGSAVGGALGGGGAAGALAGAVKGTIGEAGSIAQNVMNSKPDIKSGSGIGGSAALMGCKYPYLIIERPRKSTPMVGDFAQNHWTGYPSNIAAKLGDLEGYTEVSRIFVNRTNATADEKLEIEKLLNEGVYL